MIAVVGQGLFCAGFRSIRLGGLPAGTAVFNEEWESARLNDGIIRSLAPDSVRPEPMSSSSDSDGSGYVWLGAGLAVGGLIVMAIGLGSKPVPDEMNQDRDVLIVGGITFTLLGSLVMLLGLL